MRLHVDQIETTAPEDGVADPADVLEKRPDEARAVAQERFRAIEPLLNRPDRRQGQVGEAVATASVAPTILYKWIGRFEKSGHLSSLLPRKTRRRQGSKHFSAETEEIVRQHIETELLCNQKRTPSAVGEAVRRYCMT